MFRQTIKYVAVLLVLATVCSRGAHGQSTTMVPMSSADIQISASASSGGAAGAAAKAASKVTGLFQGIRSNIMKAGSTVGSGVRTVEVQILHVFSEMGVGNEDVLSNVQKRGGDVEMVLITKAQDAWVKVVSTPPSKGISAVVLVIDKVMTFRNQQVLDRIYKAAGDMLHKGEAMDKKVQQCYMMHKQDVFKDTATAVASCNKGGINTSAEAIGDLLESLKAIPQTQQELAQKLEACDGMSCQAKTTASELGAFGQAGAKVGGTLAKCGTSIIVSVPKYIACTGTGIGKKGPGEAASLVNSMMSCVRG